MNTFELLNPADFHVHVRGTMGSATEVRKFIGDNLGSDAKLRRADAILDAVLAMQDQYSQTLLMPNLLPSHVRTAEEVGDYLQRVKFGGLDRGYVEPIMTISLKRETTPEMIEECARIPEFKAVKYYPGGVTTNSGGTSEDINPLDPKAQAVLRKMEELGVVLSLHGETTEKRNQYGHVIKGSVERAEREFKPIAEVIAIKYPKLKIVIEHISTREMAELVGSGKYSNVYGSVTPQHLLYTAHDKEGGHAFNPHIHCKPTLKELEDLLAIQKLVLSGNNHVFFGSDSAPHPQDTKECAHCASGVFSSPTALQEIVSWFMNPMTLKWWKEETGVDLDIDRAQLHDIVNRFFGSNGQALYGKPKTDKYVTLDERGFTIPASYPTPLPDVNIVPMNAGKTLPWSIRSIQARVGGALHNLDITPLGQIFRH